MTSEPLVTTTTPAEGIAVITLNRPDQLNSFNYALVDAMTEALHATADDDTVRAVVLAAAGRVFSAGLDLSDMSPLPGTESYGRVQAGMAAQQHLVSLVPLMHHHPKPIIAAVQGAAAGMGMGIALAADIRVAAPKGSFSAAFIRVGLGACDFGVSYLLPHLVGASRDAERFQPVLCTVDATRHRFRCKERLRTDLST